MTSPESRSALYPLQAEPGSGWFDTVASVLAEVRDHGLDATAEGDPRMPGLTGRLRAVVAESWDVSDDALQQLLTEYRPEIERLSTLFGLEPDVLLGALGRGWLPGGPEVDSEVVAASPSLPRLRGITASAAVTVSQGHARTLLIAATDVHGGYGPVRLESPHWSESGVADVWLCAVAPDRDRPRVVRQLLERCLPHAGVEAYEVMLVDPRSVLAGSPTFGIAPVIALTALLVVSGGADADLVAGRLEGWRQAIERLVVGEVEIRWTDRSLGLVVDGASSTASGRA